MVHEVITRGAASIVITSVVLPVFVAETLTEEKEERREIGN